jgi:Tfp pilus assembly protein PilV
MKIPGTRRQSRRGTTLIELLVAGLLLAIGMMGLVNTWVFSFNVTTNTDNSAIAYSLGRFAIERVKMSGFHPTTSNEGTTDAYYNGNQVSVASNATNCRFRVTTSVVSDQVASGTAGVAGAVPADGALRTVTITVRLQPAGTTLYTTTTYMARAGI